MPVGIQATGIPILPVVTPVQSCIPVTMSTYITLLSLTLPLKVVEERSFYRTTRISHSKHVNSSDVKL